MSCPSAILCDPGTDDIVMVVADGAGNVTYTNLNTGAAFVGDPATLVDCATDIGQATVTSNGDNTATIAGTDSAGTNTAATVLSDVLVNDGAYGSSRSIDPDVDILLTEQQPHDPSGWPFDNALCPVESGKPVYKSANDGQLYTTPECETIRQFESITPLTQNITYNNDELLALNGGVNGQLATGGVIVHAFTSQCFTNTQPHGRPMKPRVMIQNHGIAVLAFPLTFTRVFLHMVSQNCGTGVPTTPTATLPTNWGTIGNGIVNTRGMVTGTSEHQNLIQGFSNRPPAITDICYDAGDGFELAFFITMVPYDAPWANSSRDLQLTSGFSGPLDVTVDWECCL